MLTSVDGFWLRIIAPTDFVLQELTLGPFPPGTNIYANISLNEINTYFTEFTGGSTDPKFVATSWISSWTTWLENGTESEHEGMGFNQNAVLVPNCAHITFAITGLRVVATALVNLFTL
jgi:hypothetical protein